MQPYKKYWQDVKNFVEQISIMQWCKNVPYEWKLILPSKIVLTTSFYS